MASTDTMTSPETRTDDEVLNDLDKAFERMFKVVVVDSPHTTFDQVIYSLVELLKYTEAEAGLIALQVDRHGSAIVHYCRKTEADRLVDQLQRRNVRARAELMPAA